MVAELLARLRDRRDDPAAAGGTVALVGASGSGKSSVLMAGLMPAINAGALDGGGIRWMARYLTPDQLADEGYPAADPPDSCRPTGPDPAPAAPTGPHPAPAAPTGRDPALASPTGPARKTVLIVDQFEEALTLPEDRRSEMLARLRPLQEQALVVIGLRADFYQAAAAEPVLLPALRHGQVLLGPMTADELREAVLGPARRVGVAVEDGLVDLVLADLAPGSPHGFAHEAGALPLLSYALLAAWEGAEYNQLTVAGYRSVGGLRGAVSQAGEELYRELSEQDREAARAVFSRLIRLDGAGPPTRRRASRQEVLETGDADRDRAARLVLERFVAGRLLTADAEHVQISHEALLAAWPRLRDWVESNREWLRLRHQLSDAAGAWAAAERDESLLWAGARLASASEQAGQPGAPDRQLSRVESEFLAASIGHRDRQLRAARRRARRTQQLLGVVGLLAVTAIVLAAVAVNARDNAVSTGHQALSRQVAVEAVDLAPSEPALAAELALAAYRISPTVQARSALVDATAGPLPTRLLGPDGPQFIALSGDGRLLAIAQPVLAAPGGVPMKAVQYSADGHRLAAAGGSGTVVVWTDGGSQPQIARAGGASTLASVSLSPDGRLVIAAASDATLQIWKAPPSGALEPARSPITAATAQLNCSAFSPDGSLLAVGSSDGSVHLYDTRTWAVADSFNMPNPVTAVGFAPGAQQLITADAGGYTRIWALPAPGTYKEPGSVFSLNFAYGGRLLAAGTSGKQGQVSLWDTSRPHDAVRLGAAPDPRGFGPVEGASAVSPDGHLIAAADSSADIQLFTLAPDGSAHPIGGVLTGSKPHIEQLGFTPDSRILVAGDDGSQLRLWDVSHPEHPQLLSTVSDGSGEVLSFGIDPTRAVVAVGDSDNRIRLYDIANPRRPVLRATLGGFGSYVFGTAITPDGRTVIGGSADRTVRMWDITDPAHPRLLGGPLTGPTSDVYQVAVSPDGRTLAAATTDHSVWLWDISDRSAPRLLDTLRAAQDAVSAVGFSPDGRVLVASGTDATLHFWDYRPGEAIQRVCSLVGTPITRSEWATYVQGAPYRPSCR